jgi:enoyl-CoA hydratase/carnithine racemase
MIELTREGDVHVLRVDAGENRFGPEVLKGWNAALNEVESVDGPKALVTTGSGKFYSNGLDLDYMLSEGVDGNAYVAEVLALIGRVLTFPAISVSALNGHAFGAGAQIALAHDYRVMRSDRGYFCMPEIDMRAPLHPGMTAIIKARLTGPVAHEVIVTGTRYGGELAQDRGIVDHAVSSDEVLPRAVEIAAERAGKAHPVMSRLKAELYPQVIEALRAEMLPID